MRPCSRLCDLVPDYFSCFVTCHFLILTLFYSYKEPLAVSQTHYATMDFCIFECVCPFARNVLVTFFSLSNSTYSPKLLSYMMLLKKSFWTTFHLRHPSDVCHHLTFTMVLIIASFQLDQKLPKKKIMYYFFFHHQYLN